MSKSLILRDEARRLYVNDGLTLEAIFEILKGKISKRTLYLWKEQDEWDKKRTENVRHNENIKDGIIKIVKLCLKRAEEDPNPHNIYALAKAIAALREADAVKIFENKESPSEKTKLTDEELKKIQKEILGIDNV